MIAEGLALVDKALRHRRPGSYQVQAAIAALHARAARPQDTDWAEIDALYATLERLQPSPVVTLNRAVAVAKLPRRGGRARDDRAAGRPAVGIFPLLRRQGCVPDPARPHRGSREAFGHAIALAIRRRKPRISGCISTA